MVLDPDKGHRALRRGRASLPGQIYIITVTTLNRAPLFRDHTAACAASRCFNDPTSLGDASLLAWVLMPDHAHWLLQLGERDQLPTAVARLKSASARRVNEVLGRLGALWSRAYHDRAIREDEDLRAAARYLVLNPVRAGLVEKAGDYSYWNANWLS